MQTLGIIGGGRAAWSFGRSWLDAGWPIAGVALREESRSPVPQLLGTEILPVAQLAQTSEIILFAVPDDALAALYQQHRHQIPNDRVLFHASGARSSDLFEGHPLRFSLHPLRSLSSPGDRPDLSGTLFVFEGVTGCRDIAERLTRKLGARLAVIDSARKPLYHAAAVFGSNDVATLLEVSRRLFREAGIEEPIEHEIGELARSSIENWRRNEGVERFTGPIARGDRAIVGAHLRALETLPSDRELYRRLALELADILLRQDPSRTEVREIQELLTRARVP